jgi:hypothetical protein
MTPAPDRRDARRLGDPYAFAVLQWPAVVGALELPDAGWWVALKFALCLWVGLLALAATFGRRGAGPAFGLATSLCAALVAAFWASHPGAWMYLWLALLPIGFYAAQRARLDEPDRAKVE